MPDWFNTTFVIISIIGIIWHVHDAWRKHNQLMARISPKPLKANRFAMPQDDDAEDLDAGWINVEFLY